jgi:Domain of unknown function (DUF4190)
MTNPPGDAPTPPENPDDRSSDSEQSQRPRPEGQQPGYWEQQAQQPGPAYPTPPPGYPTQGQVQYAPDHPKATTSLVLGILGVVLCQVLAPFAWSMGRKTLNEIDASQGRVGGRGAAQAGYILGIVGTVLLALSVIFIVIYGIFMIAVIGGGIASSS